MPGHSCALCVLCVCAQRLILSCGVCVFVCVYFCVYVTVEGVDSGLKDLFLRILNAIDEEIVAFHVDRTPEEVCACVVVRCCVLLSCLYM